MTPKPSRHITACALLVALAAVFAHQAQATHLRAGEITVQRDNCTGLVFTITLTLYTNTKSDVRVGGEGEILYFGDGQWVEVPLIENTTRSDLNPDGSVATATYVIRHTYPGTGLYTIRYQEPNRNRDVLNMDASVNTPFYLETQFLVDSYLGCSNSPRLLVAPIDIACKGAAFTHNPGAYDIDGDSLSYSLEVPFMAPNTTVVNYKSPADPKFYTNYETANEAGSGRPRFIINPLDGTLTWDAPGAIGEYNIAFHITEWRRKNGVLYKMGYVRRDMQIIVDDCSNKRPDLMIPKDTCVVAGTVLDETILGIDPDNDAVKIEAFSEIFNYPVSMSPATYSPVPKVDDFRPSPATTIFHWQTDCAHVREQAYQVVFKITDKPKNGPHLVTFKTWFITVVAPAPDWTEASLNLSQRQATLKWDNYWCTQAETMQVWRKIDGAPFEPDNCQTGMPALGYDLIGTVVLHPSGPLSVPITEFIDNNNNLGLAPGARYCYRLVAVFPSPRGGESYVSKDTCVGPILADVPVITNVSVDHTDISNGQISVRWISPFDANTVQFPPPYHYEIFRSIGFTRGEDAVNVSPPGNFTNTTFVDNNLNTTEVVYNYSIKAYASDGTFIGTSAVASAVRNDANASYQRISLSWSATVPWSNKINTTPNKHLIYRGPEGATEADLILIDSVDANTSGFIYLDEGQWNKTPLVENETYCYRIMTRGGYGNPKIPQPLNNFSQIICAQPGDTIPPCKPLPPIRNTLDFVDCQDYYTKYCDKESFSNVIMWNAPGEAPCRRDIRAYNVYASSIKGGEFSLIAENVRDTFFIDNHLLSFARCYKIAAVDVSGNIGEQSDELCIDNCPYYELPNVFTPNSDNVNDEFSAYSIRGFDCGEGDCIPAELRLKCARFVQTVNFTVYNRWGQEVYTQYARVGNDSQSIYIDWNGKDSNRQDLSSGVYYYVAEVTFDSVDPANNTQMLKGWVHLIR
ncbi:gliding motility-associated C-terminal domain-containing protein [Chryseolinea sp. T2]|uniref:T9SS type B sorting domain-containing protein n=1 Tax=Chryseolinea sp. T2 TaxID=3129255 RepID=UPI003077270E